MMQGESEIAREEGADVVEMVRLQSAPAAVAVELSLSLVDLSRVLWDVGDEPDERPTFQASVQLLRTGIWQRMASAVAPIDRFDHPLLYIRSGLSWTVQDEEGEIFRGYGQAEQDPETLHDATRL